MSLPGQSLLVLSQEWPGILGLLGILFLSGGAIIFGLNAIFKDRLTSGEYIALGAGGALLPLLAGVLLVAFLNLFWKVPGAFTLVWILIFILAALGAARNAGWRLQLKVRQIASITLGLILLCSIFIRLAFIRGLQVPLYFDSAMHYSVITGLIKDLESSRLPDFRSFVGGYYHLGFHVMSAAFSLAFSLPVQKVMLIFGQIILALIPLPLFFIIRQETKLETPALFATLLAGWGWYMPAHMLDWGKYPALTSILSFEFVVCCLLLLRLASGRMRWLLICLTGLSILVSTFIHTRSLVLIGMVIASGLVAAGWGRLKAVPQKVVFALPIVGLAALALTIQANPVLRLALDPYLLNQGWMGLVVLVLLPLAIEAFPRAAFACLFFICLLGGAMLVSVTRFLPIYDAQTLLDRPFVEGVLFFPLALLGGLGYAGLLKLLNNSGFWQPAQKNRIMVLAALCLFGTLSAQFTRYNFLPSDCCKLYTEQDAAAFQWMDKNISRDASILIASFETVVFDSNQPAGYSGADAGIWITPFIGRNAILVPYNTDFSSQGGLDEICKLGGKYIYAGATNQSFNKALLASRPEWYARQLELPGIQVYLLTGCP